MKTNSEKSLLTAIADKSFAKGIERNSLHTISDALSEAIVIADKQLRIEYWNEAASQLFGFTDEGNFGLNISDLLLQDYKTTSFEKILQEVTDNGKWEGQIVSDKKKHIDCTILDTVSGLVIIGKDNGNYELSTGISTKDEKKFSEQKWRSVLNNSKRAIFFLDTSYRIILANELAEKLVRSAANTPELKEGVYFLDILPEARKKPVNEILNQVLLGQRMEYEVFYPKDSGKGIWLQVSCTPVRNTTNEVDEICITAYNITELKENEAALIRSEQRWKFALDGAGDGVWEYNFRTKEIYYSPLYKAMLGFTEEEFQNTVYDWQSRVHPDDFYKIIDIDTLYEDHSIVNHSIEYRLRSKSGEYVWVLDRGMLLERTPDGKPLKLIGTHTNITERKIAEEWLTKSEQRFTSFMANTPTMTWIIDEHAIFRYLNAAYMKAFNLTEDAVGKSVYNFFPKNICDQFVENNWKVFDLNRPIELTEEGVGPDGIKQIYHIYKFPLEPENGVRLLGGVALDITKRIQLEQQLADDDARKKREIIQAIINAQEKERTELAYELHDNVNQILSSSKLMLEVAAEKSDLGNDFTKRGLNYLQDAINEIRKISHNLTPASLRDISLEVAVEDVVQSINATGKLKIKYSQKTDALKKEIEPEKQLAILRIIQEQLSNILKHAHASEATISLFLNEHNLSLEIQDNGQGFDLLTTKKGLGFHSMFNRIEYYQGTIQFITSDGKGCILRIEIPV